MQNFSKKFITITLLVLVIALTSCGKRGTLTPSEKEDVPYPRTYPKPVV